MQPVWTSAWESLAIGAWYDRYPWAIDGVLYLVFFVGVAKVTLGRRYEGRGGAAIAASVGTMLAFAAATLAYRTGFTLANLGPTAWLVLLFLLGFMLFDLTRSVGLRVLPAAAVSTLVMLGVAAGIGRALDEWLIASGLLPILQSAAVASMAVLAWWLVSGVRGVLPRRPVPPPYHHGAQGDLGTNQEETRSEVEAVVRVEASLVELLGRLLEAVRREGPGPRSGKLLDEIGRRRRMVGELYRQVLRALAQAAWKSGQGRQHLPEDLARVLRAAKDNVSEFDRNLELARVANESRNRELLLGAVERLLALERRALRLAANLRAILERLRRSSTRRPPVTG